MAVSRDRDNEMRSLRLFFDDRASSIRGRSVRELCFISGRDPRLWQDGSLYRDLMDSIRSQLRLGAGMELLEVGCAAGFLASGLSTLCARYSGVDVAPGAVRVARSLGIPNATFRNADATALPFSDGMFDCSLSYDVFTNFPNFDYSKRIIGEMIRVTKPGGRIMIGSLADANCSDEYSERCLEVGRELDRRYGRLEDPPLRKSPWYCIRSRVRAGLNRPEPKITCYSYHRADFLSFGEERALKTEVFDIHGLNPYRGLRFNIVYTKGL